MPYQTASPSPAPQANRPGLYQQSSSGYQNQASPAPAQRSPYTATQQLQQNTGYQASTPGQGYAGVTPGQPYQHRQTIQQVQAQQAAQQQQQQVQQPQYQSATQAQGYTQYPTASAHERLHETYVLSDSANETIPKEIRDRFPQDDEGRILFFTKPPQDTSHIVSGRSESEKGKPLAHTQEYLDAKAKRDELIRQKKRRVQEDIARDNAANDYKRLKPGIFGEERDADGRIKADPVKAAKIREEEEAKARVEWGRKIAAFQKYFEDMRTNTAKEMAEDTFRHYGRTPEALYMADHQIKLWHEREEKWRQEQALAKQARGPERTQDELIEEDTKKMLSKNFWTGRFHDGTGRYEDDYDNRLPRPS